MILALRETRVGEFAQIILFVMMAVIVILFFGLSNLNSDAEFNALVVFAITFLGSFFVLMFVSGTAIGNRIKGSTARLFFFESISIKSIIVYVPIGVGGAFAFSYLANLSGLDEVWSRIFAIGGAGMVFLFILLKTRSILVPIFAHGFFNSIVIILRSNQFTSELLSSNPFPVPEIGITLGSLNTIASESLFQLVLVAPAEEFFKILVMSFVLISFKGKFDSKGMITIVIAGVFSVVMWAIFHLIRGGATV